MAEHAPFCRGEVYDNYRSRPCSNKAGPNGYCRMHDPEKRRAKQEARIAKWQADFEARTAALNAEARRKKFEAECAEAVKAIAAGHNDPRAFCIDIVSRFEAKG